MLKFEMVGGYTEDLTKPQNFQHGGQVHAQEWNGHLLVYTFSNTVTYKKMNTIDSLFSSTLCFDMPIQLLVTNGEL